MTVKIKLLGKNLDDITPLLIDYGFIETDNVPELIITHGGDGALLGAERDYPGIPKLPIRDYATAPTCPRHNLQNRLERFCNGEVKLSSLPKLCGMIKDTKLLAINDIFLYSAERSSALRCRINIDGELFSHEVIGDSVGLSSVHGATSYYRSITRGLFRIGMGLVFSNSTEEIDHIVLPESSNIEIEVVRGPGILIADNDPSRPLVNIGERVILTMSDETAHIYALEEFMCPWCRKLRHPDKYFLQFIPN